MKSNIGVYHLGKGSNGAAPIFTCALVALVAFIIDSVPDHIGYRIVWKI